MTYTYEHTKAFFLSVVPSLTIVVNAALAFDCAGRNFKQAACAIHM